MHVDQLHGLIRDVAEAGLLSEGHYEFRSGRHALRLLDRDRLLSDTQLASRMGYAISRHFFLNRIDVVAAPSVWGAGLAQWVGFFLEPRRPVVYSLHEGRAFTFADAAREQIEGKRVLVVDNLILTGQTLTDFVQAVAAAGGTPIGIAALADLSGVSFPIPALGLLNDSLDLYDAADCPACRRGEPLERPGY